MIFLIFFCEVFWSQDDIVFTKKNIVTASEAVCEQNWIFFQSFWFSDFSLWVEKMWWDILDKLWHSIVFWCAFLLSRGNLINLSSFLHILSNAMKLYTRPWSFMLTRERVDFCFLFSSCPTRLFTFTALCNSARPRSEVPIVKTRLEFFLKAYGKWKLSTMLAVYYTHTYVNGTHI